MRKGNGWVDILTYGQVAKWLNAGDCQKAALPGNWEVNFPG